MSTSQSSKSGASFRATLLDTPDAQVFVPTQGAPATTTDNHAGGTNKAGQGKPKNSKKPRERKMQVVKRQIQQLLGEDGSLGGFQYPSWFLGSLITAMIIVVFQFIK